MISLTFHIVYVGVTLSNDLMVPPVSYPLPIMFEQKLMIQLPSMSINTQSEQLKWNNLSLFIVI